MKFLSQHLLFVLLSLAFIIAAFYVYSNFVQPEYEMVSQMRGELIAKTDALERYQQASLKLKNILQGQQAVQLQESVSRILPITSDGSYLSAQLVGFAKLNGLAVQSLNNSIEPTISSTSTVIQSIGKLKSTIVVQGSYAGVRAYVQQLENNLLIMDLLSFSAAPKAQTDADAGEMEYTITVMSYYQQ
jgi:hypothetical protein